MADLAGKLFLGDALIFRRWCCQSTLSRCTLAHTDGLSEQLKREQCKRKRIDNSKIKQKEKNLIKTKDWVKKPKWRIGIKQKNKIKRRGKWALLHIPAPLSFIVTSTIAARPQLPWQNLSGLLAYGVTSIWVLKAGYCFCGADVGGHGKRHSWLGYAAGNSVCDPHTGGAVVNWEPQP